MEIREYRQYDEREILPLYASVGWMAYTDQPETLCRGFENSLLTLAAYEENRLIGILRAVGDGQTIVFVQDLLILPEYQRRGVGTALLRELLARYPQVRQIELTADDSPSLLAFYRKTGVVPLSELGCCGLMKD